MGGTTTMQDDVQIPAGMKPWTGGDRAPDDWDGGTVMLRNRKLWDFSDDFSDDWQHSRLPHPGDIIAYTPRTPETDEPEHPAAIAIRSAAAEIGCYEPTWEADLAMLLKGAKEYERAYFAKPVADEARAREVLAQHVKCGVADLDFCLSGERDAAIAAMLAFARDPSTLGGGGEGECRPMGWDMPSAVERREPDANRNPCRTSSTTLATPPAQPAGREAIARIVELAVVRHGVAETDLEGTLDDADAILALTPPAPDVRALMEALQDIAEAEAIPNDAVAFVWCRDIARSALARGEKA